MEKSPEKKTKEFKSEDRFLNLARKKIKKVFGIVEDLPQAQGGDSYFYFPPIGYFERKFIDESLIKKLRAGGTLLSMGAGKGWLEKLLWKGFGIKPEQIVITDIKLEPDATDLPFEKREFDMLEQWPEFQQKFDFILFPESFGVAIGAIYKKVGGNLMTFRFHDVVEELVRKVLRNDSGIRGRDIELFMSLIEMDVPTAKIRLATLEQALANLKEGGEIRFAGHLINEQQAAYLILKLKEKYPKIRFLYESSERLVIRN